MWKHFLRTNHAAEKEDPPLLEQQLLCLPPSASGMP
jgi:hypothetical protein